MRKTPMINTAFVWLNTSTNIPIRKRTMITIKLLRVLLGSNRSKNNPHTAGVSTIDMRFGKSGPQIRNFHGKAIKAKMTNAPVSTGIHSLRNRMRIKKNMLAGKTTAVIIKFTAFAARVTGISRQLIKRAAKVCQRDG